MRILKRIVEMVFIFLVPLMLLLFGLKINKVYDENNNLTSQYLTYENGIFREYNDNLHYKNLLYYNQLVDLSNKVGAVNSYTVDYSYNSWNTIYLLTNLNIDHKYLVHFYDSNAVNQSGSTYQFYINNPQTYYIGKTNKEFIFIDSVISLDFRFGNYDNQNYSGTFKINIFDLTLMFGSGYEPFTLQDLQNYDFLINFNVYNELESITIYSNDIISSYYSVNYTWYNYALVSLSDHLQFNNNFMVQFMFIYIILICMNLLLWYVFYVPFDMLFGLLLRKLEYYK